MAATLAAYGKLPTAGAVAQNGSMEQSTAGFPAFPSLFPRPTSTIHNNDFPPDKTDEINDGQEKEHISSAAKSKESEKISYADKVDRQSSDTETSHQNVKVDLPAEAALVSEVPA